MCVSCPAPRTCCLACSRTRGVSHDQSQTHGTGCMHFVTHVHTEHLLCVQTLFGMVVVIIVHLLTVGLVLRETGTLFSILLTWLCILAPKQVAKQTHRVSPLAQSLHNPSDRARVTPSPPYPNYPGSQGSWPSQELVCWGDRLLSLSVVASLGRVSGMMAAMENTSFALYANLTLTWCGGGAQLGGSTAYLVPRIALPHPPETPGPRGFPAHPLRPVRESE